LEEAQEKTLYRDTKDRIPDFPNGCDTQKIAKGRQIYGINCVPGEISDDKCIG
jgi:hypothetical protein